MYIIYYLSIQNRLVRYSKAKYHIPTSNTANSTFNIRVIFLLFYYFKIGKPGTTAIHTAPRALDGIKKLLEIPNGR